MRGADAMKFDVAQVPFSRYGSCFGFSRPDAEHAGVPGPDPSPDSASGALPALVREDV